MDEAAAALIPQLTQQLHAIATLAGWPRNLIAALKVDLVGGSLIVDYPEELAAEIEDLEYGNEGAIPNAVIRPFISRSSKSISDVMDNVVAKSFIDEIGVFNG